MKATLEHEARSTAHTRSTPGSWNKPIPQARDRTQSQLLTGVVAMLLFTKLAIEIVQLHAAGTMSAWFWTACGFSAGFALLVWLLKSATGPAAAMGAIVCMNVLMRQEFGVGWQHTAMPSLLALFLLTFAATRFGRSRKEAMGIAEHRTGRRAAQVLANLGTAGLLATGGTAGSHTSSVLFAASIAALAEATADTVSSEIGQALSSTRAGKTLLITTGRIVPPGTDGGISIAGTAAGATAASIIVLVSPFAHAAVSALCLFAAACGGLLFDSILGATVERRGWLGNDLVNFASTVFSAALAVALLRLLVLARL